jgi:uncharacterized membrane protein YkvA (DUF1232 family)
MVISLLKYMKRMRFIIKFWKLVPFLIDFLKSKDVHLLQKVFSLLLIILYVVVPFDLIPDFFTFFGIIDDLVVITLILERMVKMAPNSLKEKYNLIEQEK